MPLCNVTKTLLEAAAIRKRLNWLGERGFLLLTLLAESPSGILTMGAIAKELGLTKPSMMSRVVDGLELKGLVIRNFNILDRRKTDLQITDSGRRAREECEANLNNEVVTP